jgi:hypothetical protein
LTKRWFETNYTRNASKALTRRNISALKMGFFRVHSGCAEATSMRLADDPA